MTDKQKKYCDGLDCAICNEKEPCIYKIANELEEKLKAKEQECENNKIAHQMELDIFNKECLNLQEELKETLEQLDQLKAENEELKKIIERLNVPKHEVIDMDIALKNEKLKQTLTEIKEIAENAYCLTNGTNKDMANFAKQLLNKISEVEDVSSNSK